LQEDDGITTVNSVATGGREAPDHRTASEPASRNVREFQREVRVNEELHAVALVTLWLEGALPPQMCLDPVRADVETDRGIIGLRNGRRER
jgi:hypothetical protein